MTRSWAPVLHHPAQPDRDRDLGYDPFTIVLLHRTDHCSSANSDPFTFVRVFLRLLIRCDLLHALRFLGVRTARLTRFALLR